MEQWKCQYCSRQFNDKKNFWKHVNKTKKPCVSKEVFKNIFDEKEKHKSRSNFFENKSLKLTDENNELKNTIHKLITTKQFDNENLKNQWRTITNSLSEVKDKVDETNSISNNKFYTVTNNCIINNNNVDVIEADSYLNLGLRKKGLEKLEHISKDLLMKILDHPEFSDSLKNLVYAVYFNPNATENMTWCVNDKTTVSGALEYDRTMKCIVSKPTEEVINSNVQNIIYSISPMLNEVQESRTFNSRQAVNCNRLFDLTGNQLDLKYLKVLKELAYANRQFPIVMWNHLGVGIAVKHLRNTARLT